MGLINKKEPFLLFMGDIGALYASLWLMLLIRHFELPTSERILNHLAPFSILFVIWVFIFFIVGLYEKQTSIRINQIPPLLLQTQIFNSILAVLFFYFIPYFGINPKTNLFIYLIVSILILFFWRIFIFKFFRNGEITNTLIIASGKELIELTKEIEDGRYGLKVSNQIDTHNLSNIDFKTDIMDRIYESQIKLVILDTKDDRVIPFLPKFYNLVFSNITFLDFQDVYEGIFDKVPFSLVRHGWFLENYKTKPHNLYDSIKRLTDIVLSFIVLVPSLFLYPIVFLLLKISDGQKIFYKDLRIGKNNKKIKIFKFRSMTVKKDGSKTVSKVGSFLRKTRIDELPQLINVLRGDLSLIGPRPEKPELIEIYANEIEFYNVRHLIKPGLSGWAQMKQENHPHHVADIPATREKLSYDLFYIKNRSLFLDLKIVLQTIQTLILRKGK